MTALKTPEEQLKTGWKKIPATDKLAFCCGFFTCLAVNMFVYTNTCFTHDTIKLYADSTGIANGRILVGPLFALMNQMQIPWMIGLVSCVLMGFIVVVLARLFELKSNTSLVLLAGIVVTGDTVVSCHFFFSSLHIYCFSLLTALLAVYVCDRKKYGWPLATGLLLLSLLCYQAFWASAVSFFIFKLIRLVLEGDTDFKKHLKKIARYASAIIVAALLYYLIWQVSMRLSKTALFEYYPYETLSGRREFVLAEYAETVLSGIGYSILQLLGVVSGKVFFLGCVAAVLNVAALTLLFIKAKELLHKLVVLLYEICYLVSVNILYIAFNMSASIIRPLTVFSLIIPIPVLLWMTEKNHFFSHKKAGEVLSWATAVLCAVLVFGQAVYANSVYLKLKVNYDNGWSYATRLMDRIEQTPDFKSDTKIVLVGDGHVDTNLGQNSILHDRLDYEFRNCPYADDIRSAIGETAFAYVQTVEWFLKQEMDTSLDVVTLSQQSFEKDQSELQFLRDNKTLTGMGTFPAESSIAWIDGYLVVKLGPIIPLPESDA